MAFGDRADLAEYDHVRSAAGPAVLSGSLHPIRAQLAQNDCHNINSLRLALWQSCIPNGV